MACERYREALTDVAAGAPAARELATHVGECERCREELATLQRALAVADDVLVSFAAAEPTLELRARIRSAATELQQADERWLGGLRPAALAAAAALFVTILVLVNREGPAERRAAESGPASLASEPPPNRTEAGSPTIPNVTGPAHDTLTGPPAQPSRAPAAATRRAVVDASRSQRTTRRGAFAADTEVLVPAGESTALLRFVAQVRDGVMPESSLLVTDASLPLPEPKPVEIPPIEIALLAPAEPSQPRQEEN